MGESSSSNLDLCWNIDGRWYRCLIYAAALGIVATSGIRGSKKVVYYATEMMARPSRSRPAARKQNAMNLRQFTLPALRGDEELLVSFHIQLLNKTTTSDGGGDGDGHYDGDKEGSGNSGGEPSSTMSSTYVDKKSPTVPIATSLTSDNPEETLLDEFDVLVVSAVYNLDIRYNHDTLLNNSTDGDIGPLWSEREDWVRNAIAVRAPYVFFCDDDGLDLFRPERSLVPAPTSYVNRPLHSLSPLFDMYAGKYESVDNRDEYLLSASPTFMLAEVAESTPSAVAGGYDWFAWIDSDLAIYRERRPPPGAVWPHPGLVSLLPTDRIIISTVYHEPSRMNPQCTPEQFQKDDAAALCIDAGSWLIHRDMIGWFSDRWESMIAECVESNRGVFMPLCFDRDILMTRLWMSEPSRFLATGGRRGGAQNDLYHPNRIQNFFKPVLDGSTGWPAKAAWSPIESEDSAHSK